MKILYEPLTMADSEEFFHLAGNEKVAATMRFRCPGSREKSDEVLKNYISGANRAYALRFGEKEALWGVFVFKSEEHSDTADLSLMQLPEQWGKGLGHQVTSEMIALARKEKWYRFLEVYILEHNTASRKLAEKNGFTEKERHRFQNMTEDLVVYRLTL